MGLDGRFRLWSASIRIQSGLLPVFLDSFLISECGTASTAFIALRNRVNASGPSIISGVLDFIQFFPFSPMLTNQMSRGAEILNGINYDSNRRFHKGKTTTERVLVGAGWRDLVYRYVNCEIGICLHFHSWDKSLDLETGDLAMVFQKAVTRGPNRLKPSAVGNADLGISVRRPRADDVKLSMPVLPRPVVKDAETPIQTNNGKVRRQFGSLVRLYRVNKVPTLLREWRYLPSGVAEFSGSETDGKLQTILVGGRVLPALNDGGLVNASVKRGTQVVEGLSQFESEGRRERVILHDVDSPCPVILHIYRGVVGIFFEKVSPKFPEGFAMSTCLFDTVPAPLEW